MEQLLASPWTWVVAVVLVLVGLVLRYRALERLGTPLPPGAGGARLIGATGTVETDHRPGAQQGTVRVLGDDWRIAEEVTAALRPGDEVRVVEVVGTRLVVTPTASSPDTDPSRPHDPANHDG